MMRSAAAQISRRQLVQLTPVLLVLTSTLLLAAALGMRASTTLFAGVLALAAGLVLLLRPILGLPALLLVALVVSRDFSTGTDVKLNLAALLVPALLVVWLLDKLRRHDMHFAASRANLPLVLFLGAGLLSLLIGRATWNISVPTGGNFILVQLAQWAIFAFSAFAFWLAANLLKDEANLRRLTLAFLALGGILAIAITVLGVDWVVGSISTSAVFRAPFLALLAGLAGGQLLFNRKLSPAWRAFLIAVVLAILYFAFRVQQEVTSTWVGVAAVTGVLIWLRWPRLRWPLVLVIVILVALGVLIPNVYEFAGGDQEWQGSGGSRLALIERVIDVTMRNPITGLGPAAYRPYAAMTPLRYDNAVWVVPMVNSHNNYVDIFAHTGLVGLALFLWFMAEVAWLAWRLRRRFQQGFTAGYVNGMLATLAGIMVVMLLLDWFLPFVYNSGFETFQASVLVWLFLGGLVAIENWREGKDGNEGKGGDEEQMHLSKERKLHG
jgi:O-antigen ligase